MRRISLLVFLFIPIVVNASSDFATQSIDAKTAARGFEFGDTSGIFIISVPPGALEKPAEIDLRASELQSDRAPKEWTVDAAYEYLFSGQSEVVLAKPLGIIFRYRDDDAKLKTILVWDNARKNWKVLPSIMRGKENEVLAWLSSPAARVAVASHATRLYEGEASWYPDRLTPKTPFGVASNVYPIGVKLRVTSQDTGDAIVVTVVSRGPYHNGRIIDLTKTAFSKLGHPRKQGVIKVRVEPVTSKSSDVSKPSKSSKASTGGAHR